MREAYNDMFYAWILILNAWDIVVFYLKIFVIWKVCLILTEALRMALPLRVQNRSYIICDVLVDVKSCCLYTL